MGSLNGLEEAMAADRKAALDLHLELRGRGLTPELVRDFMTTQYRGGTDLVERWDKFGGRQEYNRIRDEILNLPSDVWQKVVPPPPDSWTTNYIHPSGRQGTMADEAANRLSELRPNGAAGSTAQLVGQAFGASPETQKALAQAGNNVGDLAGAAAGVKAGRDANQALSQQTSPRATTQVERAYQQRVPEPQRPAKDPSAAPKVEGPRPTVPEAKVPSAAPKVEGPRPTVPEAKVPSAAPKVEGPRPTVPEAKVPSAAPKVEGPRPTVPEAKVPTRAEPMKPGAGDAQATPKSEPVKPGTSSPGAKDGSAAGKPTQPPVGRSDGSHNLPRAGTKPFHADVDRAFAGTLQSAPRPTKEMQTVYGLVDTVVERSAQRAATDPVFRGHYDKGNMTQAGTRFHTIAKEEARGLAKEGKVPPDYEVRAEVTKVGPQGDSRLDLQVRSPSGLHEFDYKPTGKAGIAREVIKPDTGEMARHREAVAHTDGTTLRTQESRSWKPEVDWEIAKHKPGEAVKPPSAEKGVGAPPGGATQPERPAQPPAAAPKAEKPKVEPAKAERQGQPPAAAPKVDKPKVEPAKAERSPTTKPAVDKAYGPTPGAGGPKTDKPKVDKPTVGDASTAKPADKPKVEPPKTEAPKAAPPQTPPVVPRRP